MVDLNIELPEGFLEEEERCGYTVSREMKEVWAVELDLLKTLLEVCEAQGLKIYIDAGSLLGAVRHKGFIPWDDDIDLVMFRDDYDRLIQEAPSLFSAPYFLQSAYTDKGYFRGHAQFRNSETTAILNIETNCCIKYNQGIFLDIFVLDGVCAEQNKIIRQKKRIQTLNHYIDEMVKFQNDKKMIGSTKKAKFGVRVLSLLGMNCMKLFIEKERLLKACDILDCEYVAPLAFIYETEKRIRNKHLYDETVWLDFENMKVPAPAGYDEFLKNRYGDYMKPAQIPTTHGGVFFDTDKSYLEYREKNDNE